MGFTVYATVSLYLKGLGASKVFDYKSGTVVSDLVVAATQNGLELEQLLSCHGEVRGSRDVLKEFEQRGILRLTSAPIATQHSPQEEAIEVSFVERPSNKEERLEQSECIWDMAER